MLKIMSGGQTGVDRAALDVALELGYAVSGWCPKGRTAEDGPIALKYPLKETPSAKYAERTEWNVRDSDGTLIILFSYLPGPGTELTIALLKQYQKPFLIVDSTVTPNDVQTWVTQNHIEILNIAGPRESAQNKIYSKTVAFLRKCISNFNIS